MLARTWLFLAVVGVAAAGLASCASTTKGSAPGPPTIDEVSKRVWLVSTGESTMEGVTLRRPSRFILAWDWPLTDPGAVVRVRRVATGEELARWTVMRLGPGTDFDTLTPDAPVTFDYVSDPFVVEEFELEMKSDAGGSQTRRFAPRWVR